VPSVTAGTGYGKLTLISNVFLGAQGSTNNSLVNVGNNQTLVAESNDIRSWAVTSGAIFTLGTGVVTNISANGYGTGTQANGTFMAGTNPIGGWIVDNNGKTTKYPQIAADMTTQAAAFPLTNMYIVPTSGNGQYRVCYDAKVTRAATTSSVLGGSAGFQVQYVDNDDSVVVTTPAWWGGNNNGSAPTSATINTTQAYVSGCFPINAKPANAISIQFGYTSAGATSMQYNLHVRLEQTQ